MTTTTAPVRGPLVAAAYFLHFATVGVAMPFLPAHFRNLGLSGGEIGLLLALSPAMTLLVPPMWGRLADRWGRPERVLACVLWGAALCFVPLVQATSLPAIALTLGAHAFFACAVTALLDSLALSAIARTGGSFARLRLFGSLGFVVSTTTTGLLSARVDARTVMVVAGLLLLSATFALLLALHVRGPARGSTSRVSPVEGRGLLREPALRVLLCACALHWIAGAPFHGAFAIHVAALGLAPWVVGVSIGAGVLAETVIMAFYPRLRARATERHLLVVSFGVTVARWLGMALAEDPAWLIALSLLHGLTFGAFYAAAIGATARLVPVARRAEGQALFAAVTFGFGGLVGYVFGGLGYDALGGHGLFAVAAGVEAVALWVVWRLPEPAAV